MTKGRNISDQFNAKLALETLRRDKTTQEIASKRQSPPNQVNTWKWQAIDGVAELLHQLHFTSLFGLPVHSSSEPQSQKFCHHQLLPKAHALTPPSDWKMFVEKQEILAAKVLNSVFGGVVFFRRRCN